MSGIWKVLLIAGCVTAVICGRVEDTVRLLLRSGEESLSLVLKLTGAMALWGGLMGIMEETGDVTRIGGWCQRGLKRLFGPIGDEACWNAIGVNLTANLLGLGNAATPAGMEAARRLGTMGADGAHGLAMLLVINNAGVQLIPTTVIMLRSAAGAAAPADVWGVILLASLISAGTGIAALLLLRWVGGWLNAHIRGSIDRRRGGNRAAGQRETM